MWQLVQVQDPQDHTWAIQARQLLDRIAVERNNQHPYLPGHGAANGLDQGNPRHQCLPHQDAFRSSYTGFTNPGKMHTHTFVPQQPSSSFTQPLLHLHHLLINNSGGGEGVAARKPSAHMEFNDPMGSPLIGAGLNGNASKPWAYFDRITEYESKCKSSRCVTRNADKSGSNAGRQQACPAVLSASRITNIPRS